MQYKPFFQLPRERACACTTCAWQAHSVDHIAQHALCADLECLDEAGREIVNEAHSVREDDLAPRWQHSLPQHRVQRLKEPAKYHC